MKKLSTGTIVALVVGAILVIWGISSYNGLVSKDEAVSKAWSDVKVMYQRRIDLINNLVATVKGYAEHEKSTLEAVVQARANATSINVQNLSDADINKYLSAQDQLGRALGRLIAVSESYPDLKANKNFEDLQVQLEGSENRIATARKDFTESVNAYNKSVRRFPSSIIASLFGFENKEYFDSTPGAEEAPKVEF